jgi:hypothetical protein
VASTSFAAAPVASGEAGAPDAATFCTGGEPKELVGICENGLGAAAEATADVIC